MAKRKLILDVDTGTDDAVAIMCAALHPDLDLVACTTVNGNVEVQYCTNNTLTGAASSSAAATCRSTKGSIVRSRGPIFPFRARKNSTMAYTVANCRFPTRRLRKQATNAVDFLIDVYKNTTDEIVLMPVGPLSNIAAALAVYPKLDRPRSRSDHHGRRASQGQHHAIGRVQHMGRSRGRRESVRRRVSQGDDAAAGRHAQGAGLDRAQPEIGGAGDECRPCGLAVHRPAHPRLRRQPADGGAQRGACSRCALRQLYARSRASSRHCSVTSTSNATERSRSGGPWSTRIIAISRTRTATSPSAPIGRSSATFWRRRLRLGPGLN